MMQSIIALSLLEKAINNYIGLDKSCQQGLSKLSGNTLGITLTGINVTFYMVFAENYIYLQSELNATPSLTIKAAPMSLFRLFATEANDLLYSGEVEIHGNVLVAQQIKQLFSTIKIDWEYYLSLFVGDVVANESKKMMVNNFNRFKGLTQRFRKNLTEYLQEEVNVLPSSNLVEDFSVSVDTLKNDIARFEQRVKFLESELEK